MKDDGMFPREPAKTTPHEREEEYQRSQDPHYLIEQYRREPARAMAELTAKHDRPELREAMGWLAGVGRPERRKALRREIRRRHEGAPVENGDRQRGVARDIGAQGVSGETAGTESAEREKATEWPGSGDSHFQKRDQISPTGC